MGCEGNRIGSRELVLSIDVDLVIELIRYINSQENRHACLTDDPVRIGLSYLIP